MDLWKRKESCQQKQLTRRSMQSQRYSKGGKPGAERRYKRRKRQTRKHQGIKLIPSTSVLIARSKDACGLINKSSDPIVNIDTEDVDNHLAMVDYVEDLYKFYKLEENSSHIHDYMGKNLILMRE